MPSCFDPFRDRLSRDIRNDLSESLLLCLRTNSMDAAREVAERYLAGFLEPCHRNYIHQRLDRFGRFLELAQGESDQLRWGFMLWDLGLYFEMHEVLEQAWRTATGTEKALLQALIRAAGVRIKRDCGFLDAARKIENRALPVLLVHKDRLLHYTDPERFFAALREVS